VTQHRVLTALSALLLMAGTVQGLRGGWIHAKAGLAQILMQMSWEKTRTTGGDHRPWPWADTWPVARLSFNENHGHVVLAGASGRNLAFAPAHLDGSAEPGESGTCVIAGHRDTHFANLDGLAIGQTVVLEDREGSKHGYRVVAASVVDQTETWVMTESEEPSLVLVTCWPFDGLAEGSQRYVVWAEAED
jgi:sortase A